MIERKPLNKLAVLALRELDRNTAPILQDILAAAADADGISAAEGWSFDPATKGWVREVADDA